MVYVGETIRIQVTLLDYDGTVYDPDSQAVGLYKPDGVQQGSDDVSPTKVSTGIYYTDWDIPSAGPLGTWRVKWSATESSKVSIGIKTFTVEDI
jgi:hypothetical protein